jgi:DNA polymerase III subunit delta
MTITLTGENSYLLINELRRLTREFKKENGPLSVEGIDAEDADAEKLKGAISGIDLFAPKKLIVINDASKNKEFSESVEQIFENIPESTDVIFVEQNIDKRLSFYKTLKKNTDLREYKNIDFQGLVVWAVNRAKDLGGNISQRDARYLVERSGLDQQNLSHELEKLVLYDKNIRREQVDLLIEQTPQSTIFQLLEAAFSGNKKRAMQLYEEQREMKVEPQKIIAMIAWQLNIISLAKSAGDRSSNQIASDSKLSPYSLSKSLAIARNFSVTRLREMVRELLDIDVRSKSTKIDLDSALELYLLSL